MRLKQPINLNSTDFLRNEYAYYRWMRSAAPVSKARMGRLMQMYVLARYDDGAVEVGPLARMLVGYAAGHDKVVALVDTVLGALGAGARPEAGRAARGKVRARVFGPPTAPAWRGC